MSPEIGLPNVKVHLDTFHMIREEDDFTAAVLATEGYLGYVHACENQRGILSRTSSQPGPAASVHLIPDEPRDRPAERESSSGYVPHDPRGGRLHCSRPPRGSCGTY